MLTSSRLGRRTKGNTRATIRHRLSQATTTRKTAGGIKEFAAYESIASIVSRLVNVP
jgi:hypothetical protein